MTRTQLVALVAAQLAPDHEEEGRGLAGIASLANNLVSAVEKECGREAHDFDMSRLNDVLMRVGR